MDLSKLSTSDKLIAGSGLVLFIASFLPWFTVSLTGAPGLDGLSEDANGWDVGFMWAGLPALLGLAAAGIVLATRLGSATMPDLPVTWGQAFLGAGAVSAVLVVLKLLVGEDGNAFVDVDRAWGLFLAAVAAVGFAVGGFLRFQEEQGRPATPGL